MPIEVDVRAELETLLSTRAVQPDFQPIVDLITGETVAYEALARGPVGSPLQWPGPLFDAARTAGRIPDLDHLCRMRALETAADSALRGPFGLFVNVEPAAATVVDLPNALSAALREKGIRLVAELTERALVDDPARLLGFADRARAAGWAIALDDVGASTDSLALMPFLRPDVVKLDLGLVQRRPDGAVAETMTAVTAYAEQCHAVVLAEGIETEHHERVARSLGATLGQGWRYARPGPPAGLGATPVPRRPLTVWPSPAPPVSRSPFAAAATVRTPQRGAKSLLVEVSLLLERQAAELNRPAVVLSCFQEARWFTRATAQRYVDLATRTTLVVVLGQGLSAEPAPGVRGADLDDADPVVGEWALSVIGPHFAAALVAVDLGDDGPDRDRTFDYVLTYDRDVVLEVARSLMSRALPIAGAR